MRKRVLPRNTAQLLAALIILWLGHCCLACYSAAHWDLSHAGMKAGLYFSDVRVLSRQVASNLPSADRGELEESITATESAVESLRGIRRTIMTYGAFYHIAGLIAAVFWVWGFRVGPKWLSLIFAPVPVYGVFLFGCIM